MQNVVLATFLVIDDELHGDPRIAGPVRARRGLAVATHVSGITVHQVLHVWFLPFVRQARATGKVTERF